MKNKSNKKKILIIVGIILVVGIIAAIVFLILNSGPKMSDAEYLASVGTWEKEGSSEVIWEFAKDGTGKVTNNAGQQTYDMNWEIKDGKLTIVTKWLKEIMDEFEIKIDRGGNKFIATDTNNGQVNNFKKKDK